MAVAVRKKMKAPSKKVPPSLRNERALWDEGFAYVAGMDEVGRGAWAGPLTVGAAVLPRDKRVNGVRDSKMLTERERERLFDRIAEWCVTWSVGHATHEECDALGMSAAQKLAARRCLDGLAVPVDKVLLDGNWDFIGDGRTIKLVKGDARCLSIAAASILAKVTRDRLMREEAPHFPGYDFERNYAAFRSAVREGSITIPRILMNEPLKAQCEAFLDAIGGGDEGPATGPAGTEVVRALEALSTSLSRGGEPIKVLAG